MKPLKPLSCFLLFAFCFLPFSLLAQVNFGSRGTDFWVTCGKNTNYEANAIQFQIRIVACEEDANVHFSFTNYPLPTDLFVRAGQAHTHTFSASERLAVYNTGTGVSDLSLHVTSDKPIVVYVFNGGEFTADATNILPTPSLGTDYYAISYYPSGTYTPVLLTSWPFDAYSVIATQDNTQIHHNGNFVTTLNTGQVYYRSTFPVANIDMTGSHITADKPVAFFAMCEGVFIPKNVSAGEFLYQQIPPVHAWGTKVFVPNTVKEIERVRIIASQDGTNITKSTGTIKTEAGGKNKLTDLRAGEFVELEISMGVASGCFIEANHPIGVCSYLMGAYSDAGNKYKNLYGDPAQAWIAPVEQMVKSAFVAPFTINEVVGAWRWPYDHFAMIITPTASKNNTRVTIGNGQPTNLTGSAWLDNPQSKMSYYNMRLENKTASYLFTNNAGLFVMGYGLAEAEAYYYLAASAMRILDAFFYVNDIHFQEISDPICDQPVRFKAEIRDPMSPNPGYLKWYIDGVEEIAARDQIEWEKTFTGGKYVIKMEVVMSTGEVKIRETDITVESPVLNQPDNISVCTGETVPDIIFTGTDLSTIVWNAPNGTSIGMPANSGQGDIRSFTATNSTHETIIVTVTVTPENSVGCNGKAEIFTITVFSKDAMHIDLGKDTMICWIDSLLLGSPHPAVTSYHWQDGSTGATYTVYQQAGNYWLMVEGQCGSGSDTINISYLVDAAVNLGHDTTYCNGDEISIKLDVTNPYASYLWQDGSDSPIYIIEKAGTYSVVVSNACMSVTDEIVIEEIDCKLEFNIPNIFTPNGDGLNDTFGPEFIPVENVKKFQMYIYNRWGRMVFSTESYETLWDGNNSNGSPCPAGIYYSVIYFTDMMGKEYQRQVSITLMR